MKIGMTYDLRTDYGIEENSEVYADFCSEGEIGYLADAIRKNGYEVEMIGNMYRLRDSIQKGTFDCDLVFVEDEGIASRNREAIVPALLELYKIPYVGSDAYAMGLTQNKYHTKLVAKALGIAVPEDIYIPYPMEKGVLEEYIREHFEQSALQFPVVVKPNAEGYSMGVFLVHTMEELLEKVQYNFENYKQEVLIEELIEGEELYVPLVGTGEGVYPLNIGVARYENHDPIEIFTLNDKCFKTIVDEIPKLDEANRKKMLDWSVLLYRHLGCMDFGRIDYKLDKEGRPIFLEINPRPGLTEKGPYENCANSIGKSYTEIIGEIIQSAIGRYQLA